MIFPFYKRATAIGICNLIARSLTVGASLAAELKRPYPIAMLLSLQGLALIAALFLPTYS